jgi:hypothetical protein
MLNIYGMPLQKCSDDPLTGFLRNGCCQACDEDVGKHTICVEMTEEFLLFSRANGNDLITPQLQIDFPGLLPGDRWCVCLSRWIEAKNAGLMVAVNLEATDQSVLDIVSLETLKNYASRES